MSPRYRHIAAALLLLLCAAVPAAAQAPAASQPAKPAPGAPPAAAAASPTVPPGSPLPADYVVGPEDVLSVVFWREREMSSDVLVRPDGRISLPLLNDVEVAGLTPDQVRE